jgi:UDP-N-acetyl-D-glucosamine dehydrogenase
MSFSYLFKNNESYEVPNHLRTQEETSRIKEICNQERCGGKKIVAVQGLGFVGAVMAAVIADCEINGKAPYFVVGVDLPIPSSISKISSINRGESPFKAEDPEIDKLFKRTVNAKTNFIATWVLEVYSLADIILVDINLDAIKPEAGKAGDGYVELSSFEKAIREIGLLMRPDTLLLIETTVPPGTTEYIVKPLIEECFISRGIELSEDYPLIAHSYERVMPGANYVRSIKQFWRTFSGCNAKAARSAREFLSNVIDISGYPLCELKRPIASELAKIMENSYRAMNIAFIYEWTLFAEDIGVNLFEVVNSIKVRKGTHDNMMYPGFGVGGYCLTKDPILAEWASKNIFKRNEHLRFSIEAININDLMPHHTFDLLMKGLKNNIAGKKIAILGASYREDVDDTRNSPTITLYDDVLAAKGIPYVHDPYANIMAQREDIPIKSDLFSVLNDASAIILVVKHKEYRELILESIIEHIRDQACIIDAFNVLTDQKIKTLKEKGYTVLGVGKGHIEDPYGRD